MSNLLEFNHTGEVVGVKEPIVHSLNKTEVIVPSIPEVYNEVEGRRNVLLMGDGLGDLGMIDGFDIDELVTIGFHNDESDSDLAEYTSAFDLVISKDSEMDEVNKLIREAF